MWTFLPGVEDEMERGAWLDSALAGGIADQLGGQSTSDVYVEFSPLDVWNPASGDSTIAVLAARLIREGGGYRTTVFFTSPQGIFSHTEELRYSAERGRFEATRTLPEEAAWMQAPTLKATLTILTILRDASPVIQTAGDLREDVADCGRRVRVFTGHAAGTADGNRGAGSEDELLRGAIAERRGVRARFGTRSASHRARQPDDRNCGADEIRR